ncbi:alpha/beta fold hydrolase BchO [Roseinatronobacter bogoriensis]|uniref:Magnesium chelatase n=1 Tax=Roseinatronobacter bogoriensis subsp. barguzinensis TaxID=441209 RepID=A0A2K8K681_9RHOB|nr:MULTISPECIES: alpha/beta fold hydrolase BchO [Rhodobaca]ATX64929.1 magnesium chelatase [Rhodobaca barguzinensis]MBB4208741.1 magnesium chelatase accessory protein [Rhodobaca bogoriensis DSM 18756]TDW37991.1 magnesium chelatase accessory protein [Rhodobaca barguzinensis]TDY69839.1 magnesium chelatase accessory protein [Rhodobaca bogoriensis DSM 18756]
MQGIPADWPLRAHSRVIRCRPHEWHVQVLGQGPDVLLLHGAGASAHSFRHLAQLLHGYRAIIPDLPGQGFTRAGGMMRLGLDAMADDLAALCADQGWRPVAIIGHSAGAAIALRMAEVLPNPPRCIIGLNAALGPFDGFAGWLFPKLAKAMSASPFVAAIVTRLVSNRNQVEMLLKGTGSTLDAEGVTLYQRLVSDKRHVEGTLGMMAQWQLEPLIERLAQIMAPTLLIASDKDRAVPARVSRDAAAVIPRAEYVEVADFGHLLHEEAPYRVSELILPYLAKNSGGLSLVGGQV